MLSNNSKNDLADALAVIIGAFVACVLALALAVAITIATIWLMGGPQYQAQKKLYEACGRQFKAGIFEPACVGVVKPEKE